MSSSVLYLNKDCFSLLFNQKVRAIPIFGPFFTNQVWARPNCLPKPHPLPLPLLGSVYCTFVVVGGKAVSFMSPRRCDHNPLLHDGNRTRIIFYKPRNAHCTPEGRPAEYKLWIKMNKGMMFGRLSSNKCVCMHAICSIRKVQYVNTRAILLIVMLPRNVHFERHRSLKVHLHEILDFRFLS